MLLLPVFKLLFSTRLPSPSVSSFLFSLLPSFLHFSLHCLLVLLLTHAAALSAGLWLRIPAVVTNPRFLVTNGLRAPGVLSFPLSFLPSLLSYSYTLFLCFFFSKVSGDRLQRGILTVLASLSWHQTASLTPSPTTAAVYSEVSADPPLSLPPPPLHSTHPPPFHQHPTLHPVVLNV